MPRRMRPSKKVDVANAPANDTVTTVDARFLEALYRAHGDRVLRRATAIMRSRDAGQDVMQSVFVRALGARANLATPEAQLRWLTRIATNICFNWLRDGNRRSRILVSITAEDEARSVPVVEETLTVRALMKDVPQGLQEMAVHHFVYEMSQDELSVLLKIPRRTIGYRLHQFRSLARATAERAPPLAGGQRPPIPPRPSAAS